MINILNVTDIHSIICPHCKKYYMNKEQHYWKCPKCIISYPLNWFDEFHQFDYLINVNLEVYEQNQKDKIEQNGKNQ